MLGKKGHTSMRPEIPPWSFKNAEAICDSLGKILRGFLETYLGLFVDFVDDLFGVHVYHHAAEATSVERVNLL